MLNDIDYHLCDQILIIDYLVFMDFFRCAKLTILSSSCILISDPRDPACCTVPFCPPNPVTTEPPKINPQPGITTALGLNS